MQVTWVSYSCILTHEMLTFFSCNTSLKKKGQYNISSFKNKWSRTWTKKNRTSPQNVTPKIYIRKNYTGKFVHLACCYVLAFLARKLHVFLWVVVNFLLNTLFAALVSFVEGPWRRGTQGQGREGRQYNKIMNITTQPWARTFVLLSSVSVFSSVSFFIFSIISIIVRVYNCQWFLVLISASCQARMEQTIDFVSE